MEVSWSWHALQWPGGFQEWDFYISKNTTTIKSWRLVSNQPGLIDPYMTDSIIFNISRVSLLGSIPLVSNLGLVITVTNSSINGTEMTCDHFRLCNSIVQATLRLHIWSPPPLLYTPFYINILSYMCMYRCHLKLGSINYCICHKQKFSVTGYVV